MTHDDLTTMLRDHVTHAEPGPPHLAPVLRRGRRRLRTRRAVAGVAVVATLAVAGAVTTTALGDPDGTRTAIDPASQRALDAYDAQQMPRILDEHVRPVLERGAPDLGPMTFEADDADGQELPQDLWDKASSMSVGYGPTEHRYRVSMAHAPGEAEGDPESSCTSGLQDGSYLACTTDVDADGNVVIRTLLAIKPAAGPPDGSSMIVLAQGLDDVNLARLSFQREVKVIKSASLVTHVAETVKATDRDPASARFTASYDDLVAIGADPVLVMPAPPPGVNGCPAYSMPVDGRSRFCG